MAKTNPKKLMAAARAALAAGNAAYALVLLQDIVDAAPRDARAMQLYCQVLLAEHRPMEAIEHLTQHLAANPRAAEPAQVLSGILAEHTPVNFRTLNAEGLAAALTMDQVSPEPLARVAGLLLADAVDVNASLDAHGDPAFTTAFDGFGDLFPAMLKAAPVTHPGLERGLVALRRHFLVAAGEETLTRFEGLALALVRQCRLNEFVWSVSVAESDALKAMDRENPAQQIVGAMYRPLDQWLDAGIATDAIRPKGFRDLINTERRERHDMARAEQTLGASIAAADATGAAVAAQYEENPYPRWRWTQATEAGRARAHLDRIADPPVDGHSAGDWQGRSLYVLIAGCGTGLQAIQAARAYAPKVQVLACDISRASLRYAAMQARRHKIGNIRFAQADILKLPAFDPPFDQTVDIIESVGVLHHMADPFAGWRALLDRLAPGGVMYIGLYSATARAPLTELREKLVAEGVDGSDPDAIRAIRARILAQPANRFEESLAGSADFYTLSNVRDLLFHTHERPVDLQQISDFLDSAGLEFLQMDVRPHIAEAFAATEGSGAGNDLDAWQAFEAANPNAFDGMYLFWVQKPA